MKSTTSEKTRRQKWLAFQGRVNAVIQEAQSLLLQMLGPIERGEIQPGEMSDLGLILRELEVMFDDIRKEAKSRKELLGRILATRAAAASLSSPDGAALKVMGEFSSATPDVKQMPKIPPPGTEDYAKLLRYFDAPEKLIESGALQVSFGKMTDLLGELAAQGKNPPEGLLGTFTAAKCIFRKRKKKGKQ